MGFYLSRYQIGILWNLCHHFHYLIDCPFHIRDLHHYKGCFQNLSIHLFQNQP